MLPSRNGVRKGAAFILGWLVSLAIVVSVTVLATGNNPPRSQTAPTLASLAVKTAIGAFLVYIGVRQRRRMAQPKKPKKPPKWQATVDNMSPWYAMGLAPLLQPWGLIAAGAATGGAGPRGQLRQRPRPLLLLRAGQRLVSLSGALRGIQAGEERRPANGGQGWIETHADQVIIIGSLVLGFWLIGQSLFLIFTLGTVQARHGPLQGWLFSQVRHVSATSRHPLSMVSEWPWSGNCRKSVTA